MEFSNVIWKPFTKRKNSQSRPEYVAIKKKSLKNLKNLKKKKVNHLTLKT